MASSDAAGAVDAAPPKRRRRGSLTRERIVDAAFGLAQRRGLAAFTMPELASELDVGVTGLYWHFRTKDDLLRAMTVPATARLDAMMISPDGIAPSEWETFLRRYFHRLREAYGGHPVLADIMLTRPIPHADEAIAVAFTSIDRVLGLLVAAGFDDESAWYVFVTAMHLTQSTVVAERAQSLSEQRGAGMDREEQTRLLADADMPNLAKLVATSEVTLDLTGGPGFDIGLDMILAGARTRLQNVGPVRHSRLT